MSERVASDNYLLALFKRDMEQQLFQAARDQIVPTIEASIREAAKKAVAGMAVHLKERADQMQRELVVLLSVDSVKEKVL